MDSRDRFDRFTKRARKAMELAEEEARRLNHEVIGTEHLLLGLVRQGDGVAARVLSNLGVSMPSLRVNIETIIGRGNHPLLSNLGLTAQAKKVIELAVDEARHLSDFTIGTEHLLLGLLRESEGKLVYWRTLASPWLKYARRWPKCAALNRCGDTDL